jgi:hypothetical protein
VTELAVWLFICLATASLLRFRPVHALVIVIILWTALPAIAGHHLTGIASGSLGFHPATWLVMSVFLVQLVLHPGTLGQVVGRHPMLLLVVLVFAVGAFMTSQVNDSGGIRLMMDQIVGPFLLWWLVVAFADQNRKLALVLRNGMLMAVAAQCVLAIIQSGMGSIVFYSDDYEKLYWFNPERFDRWMGTSDSPLVLSIAISICAALALGLRNWALRFSLLVLFLIGTLITQSRTGTLTVSLIILYSILRSHMAVWARALTSLGVIIAGYYLATSTIVVGLTSRLTNDTGSGDARLRALRFIADTLPSYLGSGHGMTSSYAIARDAGLQTSIESSYLMYLVDVGFILATLYFGAQFALIFRYGSQPALLGATLAATVGVVLQHTFSAVAGTNLSGTFVWSALALMVVGWTIADDRLLPGQLEVGRYPITRPGRAEPGRAQPPSGVSPLRAAAVSTSMSERE